MNNFDQSLNYPTITGLKSLELDELSAVDFKANTIDGDIIYYNKIEGNEIIVDTQLRLTNTGVISVGDKVISDVELTYLDGVSSNIQTQINNINTNNAGLITTVNTHTNQITTLENKTRWQTTDLSSTIFNKQINFNNGNIGYVDQLYPNNFYIQSNLNNGNNIILNSGSSNIFLQSQNCYFGRLDISGIKSNLFMLANDGITWEKQSSAFTDLLKQQIITNQININNLQFSDISQSLAIQKMQVDNAIQNLSITTISSQILTLQNYDVTNTTNINNLQTKTQYITVNIPAAITTMSRPLYVTGTDCIRMYGNHSYISGWSTTTNNRDWVIGTANTNIKQLLIMNEKQDAIYLISGSRSGNTNLGQNKLFTNSNGISLRRGGITISDALVTVGEIGPTGSDNNFYINGNSTNNIIIDSAAGRTNCYSNGIDIYRGTGGRNIIGSIEPNMSDINDTSLYIKSFNDLNFYAGLGSISLGGNGPIKTFSTGMKFYSAGLFVNYYGGGVGLTDICSNTFFINTNLTNPLYLNSGAANLTLNSTNNINIRSNNINVGIGNDNVFVRTVNNSVLMMESPNALFLTSKVVYVGSQTPQNGYYSTLAFYNSNGTAWEGQNSAFTETIKTNITEMNDKFLTVAAFGGSKGKITLKRNFEIMGRPQGTTTLAPNTTYTGATNYNIGAQLHSLYPGLFAPSGKYYDMDAPKMNFNLGFELGFMCKNSTMRVFKSYIQIQDTNNILVDNSYTQGIHYRTGQTFNEIIYYNLGTFKHVISQGHQIILSTTYDFTTGSEGASTVMEGKFSIDRNLY